MSSYIGEKCIVCEKAFTKDDEIVVCPECGTPYHRDCYAIEGKCINNILHSNNKSWKAVNGQQDQNETNKCKICGAENPQSGLFCSKCGNPLANPANPNPYTQGNIPPFFSQQAG